MKRILIILLTIFSYVVSAYAQNFQVDGLSYNVTKQPGDETPGEVEVTGGEIKEEIEIPESVTYNDVTYTVTSIGNAAFEGRRNSGNFTKKYIIPGTVRSIGESAFYDNYYLEEVEFNEGLQTIGASAFGYNFLLKEIRIPSTVTSIGNSTFITNQQNRATISCLAETPPSIQPSSFSGRTEATLHVVASCGDSYEEAEYWKDFSEISDDIIFTQRCYAPKFSLDNNLLTVSCKTEGATIYYTTDGTVPNENGIRYTSPISYSTNQIIRAIAIAEGMENSAIRTFSNGEQIGSVTDEQGVQYTLEQADNGSFYYSVTGHTDEMIAEIVIPDNLGGCPVKIIKEWVFNNCSNLSSITIPESVTSIGDYAFHNCSALKIVTSEIPTPFDVNAFNRFDASLVVPQGSRSDYKKANGWNFAFTYEEGENIYDRTQTDKQGVQYTLEQADDGSVYYSVTGHADELNAEIVIPDNLGGCPVKIIKEWALNGCSNLSSITIPESVTSIGNNAFYYCSSLNMVISEIPTPFDVYAFNHFDASLVVPQGSRADYKKANGWNFAFIYEEGESIYDMTQTDEQGIQYTLVQADDGSVCYSVTGHTDELNAEIVIPDNLGGCPVTIIKESVFYNCTSLSSITIPSSVTSIGNNAFYNCSGLKMVTSEISTPFDVNAFSESFNATLVVPLGSRADYKKANGWNFAFTYEEGETIYDRTQTDGQGLCYTLRQTDDGSFYYSVTGHSDEVNTEIIIPADLSGCPVKTIEDGDKSTAGSTWERYYVYHGVFSDCADLVSVTIPNSMTHLGSSAFGGCSSLASVTLGNQLIAIKEDAFAGCTSLSSIIIPNSVTSIGARVFGKCSNLTSVILSDNLMTIGEYAFYDCSKLSSITIPNSVTNIGEFAFQGCSSMTSLSIGSGIKSLKSGTFSNCSGLTTITIPNNVTSLEDALDYAGYTSGIGNGGNWGVFSNCSSLTTITIPSSVTEIGTKAFYGCNSLRMVSSEISNPFAVEAFDRFDATLVVPEGSRDDYKSASGWEFAYTFEEGETIYERTQTDEQGLSYALKVADDGSFYYSLTGHSDELNEEIVIPADLDGCPVKIIEERLFENCTELSSITISNNVTTIGNRAFYGCSNLSTVILGSQLMTIGDYAFIRCASLSSIIIPNSVNSIGECAFQNCSGLTTVKIGNNVRNIGDNSFRDCSGITSITIPNSVTSIGEYAFYGCSGMTSLTIGNGVTVLKRGTFSGCSSLTTLTIPDNVIRMEDANMWGLYGSNGVFSHCRSLTSVTISNNITYIGTAAFIDCNLTSITIPGSVESMGSSIFSNNRNLTTAVLKDGIKEIGICMFAGCSALISVIIPDDVTSIGESAFSDCNALTSFKLPESLTSLGENVFKNCPMKSIELPNAFTVIPDGLFLGNNFQYIKLGNNVKSIGKNAFGSREPVIEIGTSTPPAIASDAFPNVEYLSDLTVIVPNSSAETAYRKAAVWQEMTFSNQNNVSEVTVETPGDLSFELITQCKMMPAKVVNLKVNGSINADDFTQMLVNMKSLLHLDLSDCDITAIPDDALNGKTQLQELTLPTNLQTIGSNAFRDCPYLTGELALPSTLTSIGESAFMGTDYTSVKLSNALKTIGDNAFNNVPISQRLVLPGKVTSVGASAFAGTQITGLVIPDGVKTIGNNAFADTPIQGHVTIPDGVKTLGEGAFRNTQLSTVFLPNSVTTLSQGLFQGCPNLNLVYVPDNYTAMNSSVFDGCESLNILRLSANTETMGSYSLQNTPLEYIKIPSKVETLPTGVLRNCTKLESLALPAELKTVEGEALYGCTALRNMSVEATTPPVIKNRSAIRGINTDKCLISIPTSAYRAYVLAEYWGQFVQMRNDIAVETEGDGEIAFESVEEDEDDEEEVSEAREFGPRRASARTMRRASQLATDDESMTYANNGSSVYVPQQGQVRFYILPAEGEQILSATLDGVDIMPYIVDGVYVATADKKNAKLVVKFSGTGGSSVIAGDVNGDGKVNITDAVGIVNYLLGNPSDGFIEAAADVNNDGSITITDAVAVVNMILESGNSVRELMPLLNNEMIPE